MQAVGTGSIEYPITGVLGPRGSGKTLLLTAIAQNAADLGYQVFANFTLKGIKYTKIKGHEIGEKATIIKNGVLLIDEMRESADSYKPFNVSVDQVATFAAQSRKRKVSIFYSAQDIMQVAVRVRRLTDLIITMYSTEYPGYHLYRIMTKDVPNELVKDYTYFYGVPLFEKYDTDEIISYGDK